MPDPRATRGYRNCNPGNIEHVEANRWQGLAAPPSDGRFCRFISHQHGIRALAALLTTYQDRHGLRTVRGIITRWAPDRENDTAAYIAAVCRHTGFGPADTLDLHRHEHIRPLVEAIIARECAGLTYPAAVLDEALTMAGVPPRSVARTDTAKTAAGTTAAAVGAIGLLEATRELAPHLGDMADLARALGPWVALALVALVAGWFVWQRARRQAEIAA